MLAGYQSAENVRDVFVEGGCRIERLQRAEQDLQLLKHCLLPCTVFKRNFYAHSPEEGVNENRKPRSSHQGKLVLTARQGAVKGGLEAGVQAWGGL